MCFFFFFPELKKNCPSQREGLRSLDAATAPAAPSPRSRAKWDGSKEKDTAVKTGRKEDSWRARETNWIRIQRNICQALLAVVWTMDNVHNAAALSFSLICC